MDATRDQPWYVVQAMVSAKMRAAEPWSRPAGKGSMTAYEDLRLVSADTVLMFSELVLLARPRSANDATTTQLLRLMNDVEYHGTDNLSLPPLRLDSVQM